MATEKLFYENVYCKTFQAKVLSCAAGKHGFDAVSYTHLDVYKRQPESMHQGLNSQKDMIDYCYSQLNGSIITVDAYSKLRAHTDEYIFFRTDHHWTQLGAYYAYTAFCEAARCV